MAGAVGRRPTGRFGTRSQRVSARNLPRVILEFSLKRFKSLAPNDIAGIRMGDGIRVKVIGFPTGHAVRLGLAAPREMAIRRDEQGPGKPPPP